MSHQDKHAFYDHDARENHRNHREENGPTEGVNVIFVKR